MVREVKKLRSEFEALGFTDPEILMERKVNGGDTGPPYDISSGIAKLTRISKAEGGRIKPALQRLASARTAVGFLSILAVGKIGGITERLGARGIEIDDGV